MRSYEEVEVTAHFKSGYQNYVHGKGMKDTQTGALLVFSGSPFMLSFI